MDTTTYELLAPDVKTAARVAHRKWPLILDVEDVEHEIWFRLLDAGQHTVDVLAGMDKSNRIVSLGMIAEQIMQKERDDYDFFSGQAVYGTDYVRSLLDRDGLLSTVDEPGTLQHSEIIDLQSGFVRLRETNANYADVIVQAYIHGNFDVDGSKGKTLTRAVDALTRHMNRARATAQANYELKGIGRSAMPNHEAQKLTRNDYVGSGWGR